MVYKACKGGVRSGNTLRGLRALRTQRYGRQACLISRSNLSGRAVDKLVRATTDDPNVKDTLNSTGVLLSLNKRQRWQLPGMLRHMISTGSFSSRATVSLLERHKLKRRANCVNFVCNKGRLQNVKPSQKRYFSLNPSRLDDIVSQRQKRRDQREEMKKNGALDDRVKGNKKVLTTLAFTQSGGSKLTPATTDDSAPEYRLEVFYPCPKTCSLTFNPKYTDVEVEVNEEGQQEVRSVVRQSQAKRTRRRAAYKEWEACSDQVIQHDVASMWAEDEDPQGTTRTEDEERQVQGNGYSENLFASFLSQAKEVKGLLVGKQTRKRNKSKRYECATKDEYSTTNHIVYEPKPEEEDVMKGDTPSLALQDIGIKSTKIILLSDESSPKNLRAKFGNAYTEADCQPRRFIINVTDDVRALLSQSRSHVEDPSFTSFLVFTHDAVYDQGLDVFNFAFNSYLVGQSEAADRVTSSFPFTVCSVDEIMHQLFGTLIDMKDGGLLETPEQSVLYSKRADAFSDLIQPSYEILSPEQELSRTNLQEREDFADELKHIVEEGEVFCDICYDIVNSSSLEGSSGTRVGKCGHNFCDGCWKSHIHSRLQDGATRVACPGYDCDVTVGTTTLLCLVQAKKVGQLVQRRREAEVDTSLNSKWCPNQGCGRVIQLAAGQPLTSDITCVCGFSGCFACLGHPHWPATCDQAELYLAKLSELKPNKETTGEDFPIAPVRRTDTPEDLVVEGRLCPVCHKFIEKNGGCPMMTCRCGYQFCWKCMEPFTKHMTNPNPCVAIEKQVMKHSRRVLVRHIAASPEEEERGKKMAVSRRGQGRASMYQRALHHRVEQSKGDAKARKLLAAKLTAACGKDLALKKQILSHCGVDEANESSLHTISTIRHVTQFLRACLDMRRGLHRVTEFTFVLLRDMPSSTEKHRALRLANDLSAFCSYFRSVLDSGDQLEPKEAVRRLVDIQRWAGRAVDHLMRSVSKLRE